MANPRPFIKNSGLPGTERQQEQRALAWALCSTLGAQQVMHCLRRSLWKARVGGASAILVHLQEAIVALNAAAELARDELTAMKEES